MLGPCSLITTCPIMCLVLMRTGVYSWRLGCLFLLREFKLPDLRKLDLTVDLTTTAHVALGSLPLFLVFSEPALWQPGAETEAGAGTAIDKLSRSRSAIDCGVALRNSSKNPLTHIISRDAAELWPIYHTNLVGSLHAVARVPPCPFRLDCPSRGQALRHRGPTSRYPNLSRQSWRLNVQGRVLYWDRA